jgi:hypothetical protein
VEERMKNPDEVFVPPVRRLTKDEQQERIAILRDVAKAGGEVSWDAIHICGHRFMSVKACVFLGDLVEPRPYNFVITDAGRAALAAEEGKP